MIGANTQIVSYTKGAWSAEHFFHAGYLRFGIFEWDEETYFWVHGEAEKVEQRSGSLLKLYFHKPEDPSAHWLAPENIALQCSPDQQLLTSDGRWVAAVELVVGDKLQHFCGNGHTAVIDSIDPPVEGVGYDMVGVHFGTLCVAGLILKGRIESPLKGREALAETEQRLGLSRWSLGT